MTHLQATARRGNDLTKTCKLVDLLIGTLLNAIRYQRIEETEQIGFDCL
jgi:hypothetical protein